jgi:hypothetical protein
VRRTVVVLLVAVAALLAAVLLVVVDARSADDGDGGSGPSVTAGSSSSTTVAPSTTASPGPGAVDARVYFVRDEHVATAGRTVRAPAVARGALEALLDGPSDREAGLGMTTAIPTGTELRSVAVDDGVATVDLDETFASGGGSLSMQLRVAQVVFTLTQFDSVERVTITLGGREVDAIGGEGVDATDLTRADVSGMTPAILVESPVPDQVVAGELRVTGIANTFEATLAYELVDRTGTTVDDGVATATAGSGTWGTFAFTVATTGSATGPATLTVWQEDAATGGRRDAYEVPLRL